MLRLSLPRLYLLRLYMLYRWGSRCRSSSPPSTHRPSSPPPLSRRCALEACPSSSGAAPPPPPTLPSVLGSPPPSWTTSSALPSLRGRRVASRASLIVGAATSLSLPCSPTTPHSRGPWRRRHMRPAGRVTPPSSLGRRSRRSSMPCCGRLRASRCAPRRRWTCGRWAWSCGSSSRMSPSSRDAPTTWCYRCSPPRRASSCPWPGWKTCRRSTC